MQTISARLRKADETDLEPVIDAIYEAAFIPDAWCEALDQICSVSEFDCAQLQSMDGLAQPRWRATDPMRDVMEKFIADGHWKNCSYPTTRWVQGYPGFLLDEDAFTRDEWATYNPLREALELHGVGWNTGTFITMPTGEIVTVSFARRLESGRADAKHVAVLDSLRPHLARAGLIATRLRLERAQNTVAMLESLGLAAAVLNTAGRVLAVNALLEKLPSTFLPLAHGRLAVTDARAQALFNDALEQMRYKPVAIVRSIPVAKRDDRQPLILHLLPLVRQAHAAFSGGDVLVVATEFKGSAMVPSPKLLNALFDLSPSEAKLAAALAKGESLKQAAADMGVTLNTARTYVERVLHKTGVHQQSQLVALLKSVPSIGDRD